MSPAHFAPRSTNFPTGRGDGGSRYDLAFSAHAIGMLTEVTRNARYFPSPANPLSESENGGETRRILSGNSAEFRR